MVEYLCEGQSFIVVDYEYLLDEIFELLADFYVFGERVLAEFDFLKGFAHSASLERTHAELKTVEDDANSPNVRGKGITKTADSFGSNKVGGATCFAFEFAGMGKLAGETEISQFEVVIAVEVEVAEFEAVLEVRYSLWRMFLEWM